MKKILIAVIALILILLIAAAIAPKEFKIEESITINKPVAEVFAYLKFLKNSDDWQTWSKMDPEMKKDFKGEDGKVGASYGWFGNSKVGIGEQEIKAISENQRIDLELRFLKPMKTTNQSYFITEAIGEKETKVTWGMTGRTPFPFNLICLMMHESVEEEFEKGLENLKNILEKIVEVDSASDLEVEGEKSEADELIAEASK